MSGSGGGGVGRGLKVVTLDVSEYTFVEGCHNPVILKDTADGLKDADVIKFAKGVKDIVIGTPYGTHGFWEGWKISRVIFHESIQYIGHAAFRKCHTLTHLVVEGRSKICSNAFTGCENLKVAVLTHVDKIGIEAFRGCKHLKTITFDPERTLYVTSRTFRGCTLLTAVPVLNFVDREAFQDCESLTTVTFKQAAGKNAYILDRAFRNCKSLKVVTIDISESTFAVRIAHNAFEGCSPEIKFVDHKKIVGNRNPCLKICSYSSGETTATPWSSMYYSLHSRPGNNPYWCIQSLRRTISVDIDMGGGNSCTVTSTLLPGELPGVPKSRLTSWNRSKLSIQRPAPPLLFSRLGGDDYTIYGWEIPGVSYKDLLRTEYPEHFPDDNFHVAYLGHKVEPALNPRELAMGIVSGADWMTGWQKNEHDGCESNYETPWTIVYHDADDAPHAPVNSPGEQRALDMEDLLRQQIELDLRYPQDKDDSDEPDSDTETEMRNEIRSRRRKIENEERDDERRSRPRTSSAMPFTDLCAVPLTNMAMG
jgi:hypothetical protein